MTTSTPLVDFDAPKSLALVRLIETLPDELWAPGTVAPELWDKALLDPARDIVSRGGKGVRGKIVEHGWRLAGGLPGGLPDDLPVVIELLHAGSLVVDDIEDDSSHRRGEPAIHRRYGVPLALNMANWLYFVAFGVLGRSAFDAEVRVALLNDVSRGLLRCHQGQALDLAVRVTELPPEHVLDVVSTSTSMKTGSLMGLASTLGARAAGGSGPMLAAIEAFGLELGLLLQMLDDWSSLAVPHRCAKGVEDLRLERPTWPWVWLAEDRSAFGRFREILVEGESPDALHALAESLVVEVGDRAPSRLDAQLQRARSRLDEIPAPPDVRDEALSDMVSLRTAFS